MSTNETPQSILHIWSMYLPTLFDKTHPYILSRGNAKSALVAGRWVDNGAPLHPHTRWMQKESPAQASTPNLWQRVRLRLSQKGYWNRLNRWSSQHLKKINPDLVHVHFGNTGAHLLPLLRNTPATKIVSFYGIDASECLRLPFYQESYRELFEVADGIIVLCEEVKERLIKAGCRAEKLHLWNIPSGVEKYPFLERERTAKTRFLICARFVEKKGYRYLFDAFERLLKEGKEVQLTMMGYGPMNPEINRRFNNEIQTGIIRVLNTELSPDFDRIYLEELKNHDVFVLPSTTAKNGDDEGGPALTMICAQASGLPVVCSNFPGSEISMIEGQTGFFCKMNDSDSLYEKMNLLINRPGKWNTMGKKGSEIVHKEFSLEGCMAKLFSVYEQHHRANVSTNH